MEDIYSVDLSSECGVIYTKLRELLADKEWKKADEETVVVMLKATRREEEGWLTPESINNFPHTDLCTIDQLWLIGSNRQFGFSVQKRIWESMGGHPDATYATWLKFCKDVGWRVSGEWIKLDVIYNTPSCKGHLPIIGLLKSWNVRWEFLRDFFSHPRL
ncbi:GUN4 domain-containing protein [Nostoc sp.]|uniref:GUN4 domain-containing protein n=1 Tax=Nostoc sp. TaxID=1180 RepID=UPI002FF63843